MEYHTKASKGDSAGSIGVLHRGGFPFPGDLREEVIPCGRSSDARGFVEPLVPSVAEDPDSRSTDQGLGRGFELTEPYNKFLCRVDAGVFDGLFVGVRPALIGDPSATEVDPGIEVLERLELIFGGALHPARPAGGWLIALGAGGSDHFDPQGGDTVPEAEHGCQLGIDPTFECVAQGSTMELKINTISQSGGRVGDWSKTMLVFPLCERARL